jgi:hypothetical protein
MDDDGDEDNDGDLIDITQLNTITNNNIFQLIIIICMKIVKTIISLEPATSSGMRN